MVNRLYLPPLKTRSHANYQKEHSMLFYKHIIIGMFHESITIHQINVHPPLSLILTIGLAFIFNTFRIASSKISFRPYWVRALHSMYLHPNSSWMILVAVYFDIGAYLGPFFLAISASLRSILFPMNILGTLFTFS